MPVTQQQIEEARTSSQAAGQQAIDFASKSSQVQQELEQALKGNLADSGLVEKRSQALADYQAAPAESRNMYGNTENESFIFNPYARDALIQRNVAQARIPYSSLSDYFSLATQSIPETVNAYGNQYANQANAMAQAAQLQRQGYGDLLGEYQMQQDEAYRQQQFQLELAKLAQSGSGGSLFGLGGGSAQPTEKKPNYSPQQVGAFSSGGEWMFNGQDWEPAQTQQSGVTGKTLAEAVARGEMSASDANFIAQQYGIPTGASAVSDPLEKNQAWEEAKRQINDALAYLQGGTTSSGKIIPKGSVGSGERNVSGFAPFFGLRKSGIGSAIPANKTEFLKILADLAGPQAFGEAGKALTETEKSLIIGKVLEGSSGETYLINQLNQMLSDIEQEQKALDPVLSPVLSSIYGY